MTIETEIYDRLSGHAGLSALVGTRVYPSLLPQDPTFPAITFSRVSAQRVAAMGSDPGVVQARFQFDVWTQIADGVDAYESMRNVMEQLRLALERWRTTSGTIVQDTFFDNELELYEDDIEVHHGIFDAEIIYEE